MFRAVLVLIELFAARIACQMPYPVCSCSYTRLIQEIAVEYRVVLNKQIPSLSFKFVVQQPYNGSKLQNNARNKAILQLAIFTEV